MAYVCGIFLVVVGFGIFAIVHWRWETWSRNKKVEEAFHDRESLSTNELFEHCFRDKGVPADIVNRVRSVLETELDVGLSRLREDDDFSKNLSFFWEYDSLAAVNILYGLEEEFRVTIADEEAARMVTPADIVTIVWAKVRSSGHTA